MLLTQPNFRLSLIALTCLVLAGSPLWDHSWAELRPGIWHEPWRWLLGHWIHHSWPHLALNAVALLGWLVLWQESFLGRAKKLLIIGFAAGLFTTWLSDGAYVVGLSGLLHGLYIASAFNPNQSEIERWTSVVVCLVIGVKVFYETALGPVAGTERLVTLPVAIEAHQSGVAAGLLYALGRYLLGRFRKKPERPTSEHQPTR